MLKLHELPGDPGKLQSRHRVGRGEGSGWGKTSGKGHKGMKARSGGGGKTAMFEGGQTPYIRRIPKFGFTNIRFRLSRAEVTLEQLNNWFSEGEVVDFETLCSRGHLPRHAQYVKVLATGEIKHRLVVRLNGFSSAAKAAIEKVGGTCETV